MGSGLADHGRGEKGLGLGLAIVRRMGQALEHRVEVRSWPGRGSVFSVEVPRAHKLRRPPRTPSSRARTPAALDGVLVLCVDNQPSILEGMTQLLNGWGCEVLTAVGTRDALATVDERSRCPDVLLVDYHLDDGDNAIHIENAGGSLGESSEIDIRGGLEDGAMRLEGTVLYLQNGQRFPFRGTWTPQPDGVVRQHFEQSTDEGQTWTTWFDGYYHRAED